MNYRMLFIISLLIIGVGFGGLFMFDEQATTPTALETTTTTPSPESAVVPEEKTIKVAVANHALKAGQILRKQDYHISEVRIDDLPQNSEKDLLRFFGEGEAISISGFLLKQDVAAGEQLNGEMLIAPKEAQFLIESVSENEVALRLYIKVENQYLLDTLQAGQQVTLYSRLQDRKRDDGFFQDIELQRNLNVLKIERFTQSDETPNESIYRNYVGYISLKMLAEQVRPLFRLPLNSELLALPQQDNLKKPVNRKGSFIRELRG